MILYSNRQWGRYSYIFLQKVTRARFVKWFTMYNGANFPSLARPKYHEGVSWLRPGSLLSLGVNVIASAATHNSFNSRDQVYKTPWRWVNLSTIKLHASICVRLASLITSAVIPWLRTFPISPSDSSSKLVVALGP